MALTAADLKKVQAKVDEAVDGLLDDLLQAAAANTGQSVADVVRQVIARRKAGS